jgi:hypothetical protein
VREEVTRRYGSWGLRERDVERWDDVLAGQAVVVARGISWKHAVDIHADPEKGSVKTENYAADVAATLDQDRVLAALWEWVKRTSGGTFGRR